MARILVRAVLCQDRPDLCDTLRKVPTVRTTNLHELAAPTKFEAYMADFGCNTAHGPDGISSELAKAGGGALFVKL